MQVVLEQIDKQYGQVFAVRDVSLTIKEGALHFFLGPSGCGKTTTLRMLAGLETPTRGRILFDGRDVTHAPATERGIGMVFQNYALWPHMSVRKNIEYGLKLRKLSKDEQKRRTEEVVSFTRLSGLEDRLPGQLSGGQQQRVALARALAIRPNVLLLDEPLSNLDAQLRLEMRENISRIHKETGITTIYVTHDQKEALSMGSSISVMRKGELIQTADPKMIYNHPKTGFIAGFIGETNLIEGTFVGSDGRMCEVDTEIGRLKAHSECQLGAGAKVHVSLRPEAVRLSFDRAKPVAADNVFSGVISHLTYLGESEQFLLTPKSGSSLKATIFHAPEHDLAEGDQVYFGAMSADVLVLPFDPSVAKG